MLQLQTSRVDVFRKRRLMTLEDEVLQHVQVFFPDRCLALGEDQARDLIRHGIERARTYGIEGEEELCKYVDISFFFGRRFDEEQPWARSILNSDEPGPSRVEALFEAAVERAAGP